MEYEDDLRTPLGGRNFEYYSEDPVVAGEMGCAFVRGVQSKGIGTSLKHYACNNQEFERMTISAEVDQRTLREMYLAAFERVVRKAQPWTVMSAYNKVNGLSASEHPQLLRTILKQEWGFEGVIVSDWGAVDEEVKALAAGLDLRMPGGGSVNRKHTESVAQAVRDGHLSEAVLDEAVARVLHLVLRGTENRRPEATFDSDAHHTLARKVAAESMVLLKNSDNLLPLQAEHLHTVALIGRFAKQPRYQGLGSSRITPTRLDAPYDEVQRWLGESVHVTYTDGYAEEELDERLLREAVEQARTAEIAMLFVGLPDTYEAEGFDRSHISLPESHNRLIAEVCKVQPNTIVVLHNGSAIAMPWIDGPKAILEVGLGGQAVGSALVDVLSGKVNPSGKLTETFPVRLEDTPAYLNELLVGPSSTDMVLSVNVQTKADPQSEIPVFTRMSPLKQFLQNPKARTVVTHALAGTSVESLLSNQNAILTPIPIGKAATFGMLTDDMVDALLERVNQAVRA